MMREHYIKGLILSLPFFTHREGLSEFCNKSQQKIGCAWIQTSSGSGLTASELSVHYGEIHFVSELYHMSTHFLKTWNMWKLYSLSFLPFSTSLGGPLLQGSRVPTDHIGAFPIEASTVPVEKGQTRLHRLWKRLFYARLMIFFQLKWYKSYWYNHVHHSVLALLFSMEDINFAG